MGTHAITMNVVTPTETHAHLTMVEIPEVIAEHHVAADTLHHIPVGTLVLTTHTIMVPHAPPTHTIVAPTIAVPIIAVHTQVAVHAQVAVAIAEAVAIVEAVDAL